MPSALGRIPSIAIGPFFLVYDRGTLTDGSWRGYYDSFDRVTDAIACAVQAHNGGYTCTVYDLSGKTVIAKFA